MWAYTLLLPWFSQAGLVPQSFLTDGPFGIALLRPQMLFNLEFDPLTHGVVWSLLVNTGLYVGVSLLRAPLSIERLQASIFVRDELPSPATPSFRLWRTSVSVEDLQRTAARYVGSDRADRSFAEHAASRKIALNPHAEADVETIRFTEHLLASAIGAASSRLVLSLLLRRRSVGDRSALRLLDDASEALHYNRDLLQSALDQVGQGITVYDRDMRLICWNREFRTLLDLPTELVRIGVPMYQVLRHLAERGDLGPGQPDGLASERMRRMAIDMQTLTVTIAPTDRVLEMRTNAMPQGGVVTSYTDITERVRAADELARANESLERRVGERTQELVVVNQALAEAKAKADTANLDKTRFLAGASHDLLQPLNAARLYTASLVETLPSGSASRIARNIDTSLDAVEEILSTLLEISRLDAGALKPEIAAFPLNELFERLRIEFEPLARDKGLRLRVVTTSLVVRSDRKLLQRALQNLVSNAIKYTDSGIVVLGCRRASAAVHIEVHDTGVGIPADKRELIFKEFQRLDPHKSRATGLGLGLSIVERVCRVLNVPISVESAERRGSRFRLTVPTAAAADVVPVALQPAMVGGLDGIAVLCIDNEPAIRDSMRTLLGGWGCTVLAAASGQEAGELLGGAATPAPDVVLADYHLDSETGFDVIEAIRARLRAEIPAIVITADRSSDVQEECRRRGYLMLRKPLKPAALRAMMARLRFQAAAE